MLRLVQVGNALPASFICDPSAEFQPGMVSELVVIGNQIMATVSNGTAPIGIIDDIKTRAFTNVSWNEEIYVPAVGVNSNGRLITPIDVKAELKKPNVLASSFTSTVNVVLNDSTAGSGRMTVWFNRMFAQTDQYETNQQYPVRANLFVSELGFLTTRRPSAIHPAVAMVTAPPTPMNTMIEFLYL